MKRLYLLFNIAIISPAFSQSLKDAPQKPEIFTIASSDLQERDMAISPDGSEMYYTVQGNQHAYSFILFRTKKKDNTWSTPQMASFSGKYGDLEPAFSSDGQKLFFSSNRMPNGDGIKDYDIWYVEKENGKWSAPVNAGGQINTSENEFYPSVSKNGNLYFTAEYDKGVGKEDIYLSEWKNGSYQESIALDTAVNSALWEFNAFVSSDESFIIFTGYGRKNDLGGGDLYLSKKLNGKWQPAKPLTMLNSNKLDYCPFVSFDEQLLFFTSASYGIPKSYSKALSYDELLQLSRSNNNGSENIYWISLKAVLDSLK